MIESLLQNCKVRSIIYFRKFLITINYFVWVCQCSLCNVEKFKHNYNSFETIAYGLWKRCGCGTVNEEQMRCVFGDDDEIMKTENNSFLCMDLLMRRVCYEVDFTLIFSEEENHLSTSVIEINWDWINDIIVDEL